MSAAASTNDRLLLATLVATALHMMLIFGLGFDALRQENRFQPVEVTLVQTSSRPPKQAEHIAQVDQSGSGREVQRDRPSAAPAMLPQPTPAAAAATRTNSGRERLATPAITTVSSPDRIVDRRGENADNADLPSTDRELARLNRELARLEASLDESRRSAEDRPRVRRLDAVSARAAVDAAYLAEWRRRVESVGNQYYPEASLRYGIYGSLRLLVTVRSDGELEDIRVLEPSGQAVLDEAAIRILRLAAPFPPFPEELRASTDKLEIVRTWQFEENPLSSK
ncbi:MAG: TonB family protein [Halieaceae bacterium]|nr:TonB family protein [Halieaceae bacterium]